MTAAPSSRQLVLELPLRTALGRDDFLVTPSNAAAVAMIDRYPDWPHHGVVLLGGTGSGKSHLLEVWRQSAGARLVTAAALGTEPPDRLLASGALAIDDAPGAALDERALFHLLNHARQTGGHILIASEKDPAHWPVALPDLASRLKALPVARLDQPDDALLRGVLVKLFTDRQIAVEETVISYLMMRMPRSLDAARAVVAAIDRVALVEQAPVTRGLAARVLQQLTEPGMFPEEG
jgi:chromosomal replication initiation ATPase DnaA